MGEVCKGHCLCGAVELEGRGKPEIEVCHCSMCQHWHGGPAMVAMFDEGVTITSGAEKIAVYESSEWAKRSFCSQCGSTLFYSLKDGPQQKSAQAGLFDLPSGLSVHEHIFVDEHPGYYAFADDAPRLTGEEVFKRFAENQS